MTQGSGSHHRYSTNETAPDVADALALRPAAGGVGPRFYVVAQPRQHNRVQRAVELPVTRAAQPVAGDWPEDAGMGLAPARAAKAASERNRPA